MEDGFGARYSSGFNLPLGVLILVVMEDGFGVC